MKTLSTILASIFVLTMMSATAWGQVPILYYDFENNTTRTTFENLVEQAINSGSGALTKVGGTGAQLTIVGVSGAGTFNGGAANGEALSTSTGGWENNSSDPGTGALNYYQFVVNTSGFSNITVSFDDQASATGPASTGVLWSTDGSTFSTTSVAVTGNATMANAGLFSLGSGANNQGSVTIRIYAYAGDRTGRSAFGSSGTFRIDNLTVFARTITSSKTLLDYPAIGLSIKSGTAFTPMYTDFTIDGSSITVSLASALQLSGTLTLTNGSLTTSGNTITLGTSGVLLETAGNTVVGNIQTIRSLAQSVNNDFGGIGVEVNASSATPGSTTVLRVTGTAQSGGGNSSIKRYFDITPATNSGLNATMVFHYDDSELNGNTESELILFRSTDGGVNWANMLYTTRDQSANTITLSGIDAMSRWTAGAESTPLPIQLASFTGSVVNNTSVLLRWTTLSELNNYGFFVQRRRPEEQIFMQLPNSFVPGHGTTVVPQYYGFTDPTAGVGAWYYRLKQVDLDGTVHFTDAIRVNIVTSVAESAPKVFALAQNFPNPFNPTTMIQYSLPSPSNDQAKGRVGVGSLVTLKVYDMLGREVATLVNEVREPGTYTVQWDARLHSVNSGGQASGFASGLYFYKLQSGTNSQLRKMLLVK